VFLLGSFRRTPRPYTWGRPCALLLPRGCPAPLKKTMFFCFFKFIGNLWYQLHQGATYSVLNVLKLMGKHFIDPKSSEILSIFQVFPCTTQIALFWCLVLLVLYKDAIFLCLLGRPNWNLGKCVHPTLHCWLFFLNLCTVSSGYLSVPILTYTNRYIEQFQERMNSR
jgi:hypothetical protein